MILIVRRRRLGLIRNTVYERMHRAEVSSTGRGAHWTARGLPPRGRHHPHTLLILLVFHPAVLEPDFDLSFCQVEQVGHLHSPRSAKVAVKVELLLQLHELGAGVSRPGPLGGGRPRRTLVSRATLHCEGMEEEEEGVNQ